MSEQQSQSSASGVASELNDLLCQDDIVSRLRNAPNWKREEFRGWKKNVSVFDRAPFEAADKIETLRAEVEALQDAIHAMLNTVGTSGENGGYGTKIGRALAFIYNVTIAVGHNNLAECGRLTREYERHNAGIEAPC